MQRRRDLRWAAVSLSGLITLLLAAGCGHSVRNAAAPPVPVAASAAAPTTPTPATAFQPYTLLPAPPPAPPVAASRHRALHLTRFHHRVYLADSDRHLYEAGRDTQGHIYPIYRDPATRVTYPLYYDPQRDNLYRLARADGGEFYRNYVGEGQTRFYGSDRDYERITPSDADRPIVTDSYNTYNYNTYNYGPSYGTGYPNNGYGPHYAGYRPPPRHSGHNDNWLWAIPVIIGAYLLLQPHHSAPPPARSGPTTVIVRQSTPITIINQITQATPVGYRPIASPRPVYVYPPGYTARPGYVSSPGNASPPGYAPRDVRPRVPVAAVAAVPLSLLAPRPPLVRPAPRPQRPVPLAARPAAPTIPHAALHPSVRQASLVRRAAVSVYRTRPTLNRRSAAVLVSRPVIHRAAPLVPRTVRRSSTERPRAIAPPTPRPVRRGIEAARPQPAARPRGADRPRPVAPPRRVSVPPAARVEGAMLRPVPTPHRPSMAHPAAVRPRPARPAPPVRAPEVKRRLDAPRRERDPKAAPKPKSVAKPGRRLM